MVSLRRRFSLHEMLYDSRAEANMKKVHKWQRMQDWQNNWVVRPICKVDNKTLCYEATTEIKKVTCERCLTKYKEKTNEAISR